METMGDEGAMDIDLLDILMMFTMAVSLTGVIHGAVKKDKRIYITAWIMVFIVIASYVILLMATEA